MKNIKKKADVEKFIPTVDLQLEEKPLTEEDVAELMRQKYYNALVELFTKAIK